MDSALDQSSTSQPFDSDDLLTACRCWTDETSSESSPSESVALSADFHRLWLGQMALVEVAAERSRSDAPLLTDTEEETLRGALENPSLQVNSKLWDDRYREGFQQRFVAIGSLVLAAHLRRSNDPANEAITRVKTAADAIAPQVSQGLQDKLTERNEAAFGTTTFEATNTPGLGTDQLPPATQLAAQARADASQQGQPWTDLQWLTVHHLLSYLLDADNNNNNDAIFSVPVALVERSDAGAEPSGAQTQNSHGRIFRLEFVRHELDDCFANGWYVDPVTQGLTIIDESLWDSLVLASRMENKLHFTSGSVCVRLDTGSVHSRSWSGGSIGAAMGVGLYLARRLKAPLQSTTLVIGALQWTPNEDLPQEASATAPWMDRPQLSVTNPAAIMPKLQAARDDQDITRVLVASQQKASYPSSVGQVTQAFETWSSFAENNWLDTNQQLGAVDTWQNIVDELQAEQQWDALLRRVADCQRQIWIGSQQAQTHQKIVPQNFLPHQIALLPQGIADDHDEQSQRPEGERVPAKFQRVTELSSLPPEAVLAADDKSDMRETLALLECLRDDRFCCLWEDAGFGKTVFTHWLRFVLCHQQAWDTLSAGLPLLTIHLVKDSVDSWPTDWDGLRGIAIERIAGWLGENSTGSNDQRAEQILKYAIERDRCVIVLDSFDQAYGSAAFQLLRDVEQRKPRLTLVTSRKEAIRTATNLDAPLFQQTIHKGTAANANALWRSSVLLGFDPVQQCQFLVAGDAPSNNHFAGLQTASENGDPETCLKALEEQFPNYEHVAALMKVPLLLSMVKQMTPDELAAAELRSDFLQRAFASLCTHVFAKETDDNVRLQGNQDRWAKVLGAVALVMMREPSLVGKYQVSQHTLPSLADVFANARDLLAKGDELLSGEAFDDARAQLQHAAPYFDAPVIEIVNGEQLQAAPQSFGFGFKLWMDFFCAHFLIKWGGCFSTEQWAEWLQPHISDPKWYDTWKLAIECLHRVEASDAESFEHGLRPLSVLFLSPTEKQVDGQWERPERPTELIWRTCGVIERVIESCEDAAQQQRLRDAQATVVLRPFQESFNACLWSSDTDEAIAAASLLPQRLWTDRLENSETGRASSLVERQQRMRLLLKGVRRLATETRRDPKVEHGAGWVQRWREWWEDPCFALCPPQGRWQELPWIGSDQDDEKAYDNERPRLQVDLQPFRMQRTTVTRQQYGLFDARRVQQMAAYDGVSDALAQHLPAHRVSWLDAFAFATWVGARLPNEAQWETACRAGHDQPTDRYGVPSQGEDGRLSYTCEIRTESANFRYELGRPAVVRCYRPNDWGLYQMHGNVREWCLDRWLEDRYADLANRSEKSPVCWDPVPDADPLAVLVSFVLRGGSYNVDYGPRFLRAAFRFYSRADERYSGYYGFRLLYCIAGES